MVRAIREQVTVQPGGLIEVRRPELRAGDRADVIVLVEDASPDGPRLPTRLTDFVGKATGLFASPEEADAYLRALRDEWDERT